MKYLNILLLIVSGWFSLNLQSQGDCKVLKPEIADHYSGKCKDGLAHGQGQATGQDTYNGQFRKGLPDGTGTYTWANGDIYTGEWSNGFREGEGAMKFKLDGKDTVLMGLWEKDLYKGPVIPGPVIIRCTSIERYTITNSGGILNRVLINFYQDGVRNRGIGDLMLSTSSGSETRLGEAVGFENIIFPVKIKVSYTTWNKVRAIQFRAEIEFEISEPGDWVVDLFN
jgi:hypothetical protein